MSTRRTVPCLMAEGAAANVMGSLYVPVPLECGWALGGQLSGKP